MWTVGNNCVTIKVNKRKGVQEIRGSSEAQFNPRISCVTLWWNWQTHLFTKQISQAGSMGSSPIRVTPLFVLYSSVLFCAR